MSTILLKKDEKIDITKTNPGLTKVTLGGGWDVNRGNGADFDLDLFAIPLKGGKATVSGTGLVYYGNMELPGLKLDKDNRTGAGDGDDERIFVDFAAIPADEDRVVIGVNIYEAAARSQKFGQVKNAYIRLINTDTNAELMKYDLSEDFGSNTAVVLGELYRHNGEWKFEAKGEGKTGPLEEILKTYA